MGIWQIHALSSVLKVPIYLTYPNIGNRNIRNDLNKLAKPISGNRAETIFILWTSNRQDMTPEHWVPNHFVPLLKILNLDIDENNTDDDMYNICQQEQSHQTHTTEKGGTRGRSDITEMSDVNMQVEEDITIYVHDLRNTENVKGTKYTVKKIDGTGYEYCL